MHLSHASVTIDDIVKTKKTVIGLPLEYGDANLSPGAPLKCIDADDAETWLVEGTIYHFARWANGLERIQVQEHPGVNFYSLRFLAVT